MMESKETLKNWAAIRYQVASLFHNFFQLLTGRELVIVVAKYNEWDSLFKQLLELQNEKL